MAVPAVTAAESRLIWEGRTMVSEDHVQAVRGLRWAKSRADRIALGLPVHPERPRRGMREIGRPDRLAEILCTQHNVLVGVRTDTALITRSADTPYPATSSPVQAPCPRCVRVSRQVWDVDLRKLRRVMSAAGERRPRPVDVREVASDTLLGFLQEQGFSS